VQENLRWASANEALTPDVTIAAKSMSPFSVTPSSQNVTDQGNIFIGCPDDINQELYKVRFEFRSIFSQLLRDAFTADRPSDSMATDRERAIAQMVHLIEQLELNLQNDDEILALQLNGQLTLTINRFGSTIFGLDSRSSDVDLVIELRIGGEKVLFPSTDCNSSNFQPTNSTKELSTKLRVIILKRIAELLESNEDKIQVIQKRFGAFVPLVKASVNYGNEPIILDISVLTEEKTLLAANRIRSVLVWHTAIPPFLFAVKQWAQLMGISDAYTGTINSYG